MGSASVKPIKTTAEKARSISPKHSVPSSDSFARPPTSDSIITLNRSSEPPLAPTLVEDLEWTDEKNEIPISDVDQPDSGLVSRSRIVRTRVVKSLRSAGSYDTTETGQPSKIEKDELQDVMTWIFQPTTADSQKKSRNITMSRYRNVNRPAGVYEHETAPSKYP